MLYYKSFKKDVPCQRKLERGKNIMMSDLTVVVPNYNNAKFLSQCIMSIYSQSVLPDEIIVVDDCSTDNSKSVLDELAEKIDILTPIFLQKNGGVSNARNVGLSNCKTKYVSFLDADDYLLNPKMYELMLSELKKNENQLVYCPFALVDIDGNRIGRKEILKRKMLSKIPVIDFLTFNFRKYIPADFICKADFIRKVGAFSFEYNLYEDMDLLIRLTQMTKIKCLPTFGKAYRQNPNGLSKAKKEKHEMVKKIIYDTYFPYLSPYLKIRIKCLKFGNKFIKKFLGVN